MPKTNITKVKYKDIELDIRHKLFIDTYITNGFNASQAYKEVYKRPESNHNTAAMGQALLTRIDVNKYYMAKLAELGVSVNEEYLIQEAKSIIEDRTTKKADKMRAIEFLGRYKGMLQPDTQVHIGVYNDLKDKKQAIIDQESL